MLQVLLCRRTLMTAGIGIGIGAARTGVHKALSAGRGARNHSTLRDDDLVSLCSKLSCPETIRNACLQLIPAADRSAGHLVRLIGGNLPSQEAAGEALRHAVRNGSRDDFRDGNIVTVDGWMLSLTETRLYALAALLASQGGNAG